MAAPDPLAEMSDFPLAPRAPSIHGTSRHFAAAPQSGSFWMIVLQNYFGPQSEEHFSKSGREQGILIQETALADSIIAHFRWSTAHWPSFATQSALNGHRQDGW